MGTSRCSFSTDCFTEYSKHHWLMQWKCSATSILGIKPLSNTILYNIDILQTNILIDLEMISYKMKFLKFLEVIWCYMKRKKRSKAMFYFCFRLIAENESVSFVICEYWFVWSIKGKVETCKTQVICICGNN